MTVRNSSTGVPAGAGNRRIEIERLLPAVDGGRYPIKRAVGDAVEVEAHMYTDGHETIAGRLLWRQQGARAWSHAPLRLRWNDEWLASFTVDEVGSYEYTVEAWIDSYRGWARDLDARIDAGQDIHVDRQIGAALLREAAGRAGGKDAERLLAVAGLLETGKDERAAVAEALSPALVDLASAYARPGQMARLKPPLKVTVERPRAASGAWYEMFPRSATSRPGSHGTFADVEERLPYIANMGFDVLYLPPIHPIGTTHRKGRNNRPLAEAGDTGSPWAIGRAEGGHKAIHPALGTIADFERLVASAASLGIEVALDIALQCSPDHPYVREHPEWFKIRPDGTVQYAENPPKRYEDIYPFNFDGDAWPELWVELHSIFEFWIEHGVRIFRVDNPHTKPFAFWEWCIAELKAAHPDVILLAEAFTRPKVMYRLAKLGFSQSYTYFAWRNTRHELETYIRELAESDVREYFRPSFWPNTPDILTEYLQQGSRAAFMVRLLLAATLSPNYGIYGPAFELMEHVPREPGSEEYLDSEKYEVRVWNLERPDGLAPFIGHVNRIRRRLGALRANRGLRFHAVDNEQVIAFSKLAPGEAGNPVLVVVNLDPHRVQSGWLHLDFEALEMEPASPIDVVDHLVDASYRWEPGSPQFIQLDPAASPGHVLELIPAGAVARP